MVKRTWLAWCLAAIAWSCGGSDDGGTTPSASGREASARPGSPNGSPGTALDLEAMLAPVPEYQGSGRNLFAYGAERQEAPEPVFEPPTPPPVVTAPRPPPPPRAPSAPAARLDVKYAGFLEKTDSDGGKSKYAIFLDGNEILAGTEGETVANRFKVVEIGLESVTVSASGSQVTQRIPLQSN